MVQSGSKTGYPQKAAGGFTPHQERVYGEMFRAIEMLGHRLEKTEAERDILADRVDSLESQAERDSMTGRYYLPVRTDNIDSFSHIPTPKWVTASTIASMLIAVIALGVVMFREPSLNNMQLAAAMLQTPPSENAASQQQTTGWQKLETEQTDFDFEAGLDSAGQNLIEPPSGDLAATVLDTRPDPLIQSILDKRTSVMDLSETAEVAAVQEPPAELVDDARYVDLHPSEDPLAFGIEEKMPLSQEVLAPISLTDIAPASGGAIALPEALPEAASKDMIEPAPEEERSENDQIQGSFEKDPRLPEEARRLERTALSGVPEAQHDLAALYASGEVVGVDYERAIFWFKKAADAGIANAYYNLGVMRHQGLGLPVDLAQSVIYYSHAAELGHAEALYNLGIAYVEGQGAERNVERGADYFERAAQAGVLQAAYNLGFLYESGSDVIKNAQAAEKWYHFAAERGHPEAQQAYARFHVN